MGNSGQKGKSKENNNGSIVKKKPDVIMDTRSDYNKIVMMCVDPMLELKIGSLAYLIGYKMAYVTENNIALPNIIAIITLKISEQNNYVYQSEGKHQQKDYQELVKLSKNNYENIRDNKKDDNTVIWDQSTKYCSQYLEPLAVTFCGKLREVIDVSQKYHQIKNMIKIESVYTYEEKILPTIYEIGKVNHSSEPLAVGSGKCLNYLHFFLKPEYAIDYGFWKFQYNENNNVNLDNIVFSKIFKTYRKVAYEQYKNNDEDNDNDDDKYDDKN